MFGGDVKEVKGLSDEGSFYPIKSFLQVNLQDYVGPFTLYFLKVRENFLNNDCIIRSSPIGQEAELGWDNKFSLEGFESSSYNFSYNFVLGFAKPYRSKIPQAGCINTLWDEAKVSCVDFLFNFGGRESIHTEFNSSRS